MAHGVVPRLPLDGQAAEQEVPAGVLRLDLEQPLERGGRLRVVLALGRVARQDLVRVRGLRVQPDRLLERRGRLRRVLLGVVRLRQRQVGRGAAGVEGERLLGRGDRLGVGALADEPPRELVPERGRPGVAVERLAELGHRLRPLGRLRVVVRADHVQVDDRIRGPLGRRRPAALGGPPRPPGPCPRAWARPRSPGTGASRARSRPRTVSPHEDTSPSPAGPGALGTRRVWSVATPGRGAGPAGTGFPGSPRSHGSGRSAGAPPG